MQVYYTYDKDGRWNGTIAPQKLRMTELEPPHGEEEYECARFNVEKNEWEIVNNYEYLHVEDAQGQEISVEAFAPLPDGATYIPADVWMLAKAKRDGKKTIREFRKQKEYGGFAFLDMRWDSAEKDELRINSAIKMFEMAGMTEFPGWKVAEGVYITATLELLQGAALSMMQHYAGAFAVEAAKTAELEALAATEGATAADIETWIAGAMREGWPG